MARADFNWVPIGHTFTAASPTVTRNFNVNGAPVDDAFLLVQVKGVDSGAHSIKINDQELAGMDLPPAPGGSEAWFTWMDHIPPGTLKANQNNRITITRQSNDNFTVSAVVVNWRE